MKYLSLNNKKLPIPSFFQVYNFGGGNADKDREIVYAELTGDTPVLVNYFYINNNIPHIFQSPLFNNAISHNSVGDLYNFIRAKLIEKGEIYYDYESVDFDFNTKIFLLDSGAFNIIKYIAKKVDYQINEFTKMIEKEVIDYYNFAHNLKFDLVICFDIGGKYTKKDGEKNDKKLNKFLSAINIDDFNNHLLDITVKYLKNKPNYYPKMFVTVHGKTPNEYKNNVKHILDVEKQNKIEFWGFALGGIASYKQVDRSWYDDIDLTKLGKREFINTITPARACKIVREIIGDRPIHALGCGGYNNIPLNYYCGATSFDAASPVRRVGDGSFASTKHVFESSPSKERFSKYFIGGINADNKMRIEHPKYVQLNEVPNNMQLCGCLACKKARHIQNIKKLYSMKEQCPEANYYSRQLIGLHAVAQHAKLCEIVSMYKSINDFSCVYNNSLFAGLKYVYEHL